MKPARDRMMTNKLNEVNSASKDVCAWTQYKVVGIEDYICAIQTHAQSLKGSPLSSRVDVYGPRKDYCAGIKPGRWVGTEILPPSV